MRTYYVTRLIDGRITTLPIAAISRHQAGQLADQVQAIRRRIAALEARRAA